MHFATSFLKLAAVLAFATQALALSIRVDVPDVAAREVVSFTHTSNEVMAPHDVELVRRVSWTYRNNQTLLLAVIAKNAYVLSATCGSGNVITCAIGATYSVLTFFFAAYTWADRRADTLEGSGVFYLIEPTADKTLRQRLTTELAAGEWHYVGHAHHQGLNHTVHYLNHGDGFHQLRARTAPFANSTNTKRYDENDDGGFVADYYWNSNNVGPYDSFHSTSDGTSYFAANAAGYMINSQQAISACTGFTDAQGALDNGIITYGWNNQPFEWEDGQMQSVFGGCANELGDGAQ